MLKAKRPIMLLQRNRPVLDLSMEATSDTNCPGVLADQPAHRWAGGR